MKFKSLVVVLVAALAFSALEAFAVTYSLQQAILPNANMIVTMDSTKGTVLDKYYKQMEEYFKTLPGMEKVMKDAELEASLDVQLWGSINMDSIPVEAPTFEQVEWMIGVYCKNGSLRPVIEKNITNFIAEPVKGVQTKLETVAIAGLNGWKFTSVRENNGKKATFVYYLVMTPDGKYVFFGQKAALESRLGRPVAANCPLMADLAKGALPGSQANMIFAMPKVLKQVFVAMDKDKKEASAGLEILSKLERVQGSTHFRADSIMSKVDVTFTDVEIATKVKTNYVDAALKSAPLLGMMAMPGHQLKLFGNLKGYQKENMVGMSVVVPEEDLVVIGKFIAEKVGDELLKSEQSDEVVPAAAPASAPAAAPVQKK